MAVTRRGFLKISAALLAGGAGVDLSSPSAYAKPLKIQYARQTTGICPYCAVGCGIIVHSRHNKVIYVEGDPDHPINRGALCAKGSSLYQLANNQYRVREVLYRAPYSDKWQAKSWDWALKRIAEKIRDTRDATFEKTNVRGQTVNRTEAIASVGSAALNNEECYLYQKFLRSLGLVYIEHQARI